MIPVSAFNTPYFALSKSSFGPRS